VDQDAPVLPVYLYVIYLLPPVHPPNIHLKVRTGSMPHRRLRRVRQTQPSLLEQSCKHHLSRPSDHFLPHFLPSPLNLIFFTEPIQVGYSYSSDSQSINSSPAAAKDVYTFLQLFFRRFGNKYSHGGLHVTGESYGGIYIPNIVNEIWQQNKKVGLGLVGNGEEDRILLPLESAAIGNGLSSPLLQVRRVVNPYMRL
jgi:carboxypeptidase C (cathepsin A)